MIPSQTRLRVKQFIYNDQQKNDTILHEWDNETKDSNYSINVITPGNLSVQLIDPTTDTTAYAGDSLNMTCRVNCTIDCTNIKVFAYYYNSSWQEVSGTGGLILSASESNPHYLGDIIGGGYLDTVFQLKANLAGDYKIACNATYDNGVTGLSNNATIRNYEINGNYSSHYFNETTYSGTEYSYSSVLPQVIQENLLMTFNYSQPLENALILVPQNISFFGYFTRNYLKTPPKAYVNWQLIDYYNGTETQVCRTPTGTNGIQVGAGSVLTARCEITSDYVVNESHLLQVKIFVYVAWTNVAYNITHYWDTINASSRYNLRRIIGPKITAVNIAPDDDPATSGVQVNPVSCSNKTITVNASVSGMPSNVFAKLWDSSHNESSYNYFSYLSLTSGYYIGAINISYTDSPGEWNVSVYANTTSYTNTNSTNFTYNTLYSISLSNAPIIFKSSNPGDTVNATVGNGFPLNITNCGNIVFPMNMSGTNMTGVTNASYWIPVTNINYSTTSYPIITPLTTTSTFVSNILVNNYSSLYFDLYVPLGVIAQTYQGTLMITSS